MRAIAKSLIDDVDVFAVEVPEVEYFHILFDQHELVLSEGAWSESFHPGLQSFSSFEDSTRAEISSLYSGLREDAGSYGAAVRYALNHAEAALLFLARTTRVSFSKRLMSTKA